jgi:hypothetical protein
MATFLREREIRINRHDGGRRTPEAKIRRIGDGGAPHKLRSAPSCFIPWPEEFLSSPAPASKRRIIPIILAKHCRKPLCCGQ